MRLSLLLAVPAALSAAASDAAAAQPAPNDTVRLEIGSREVDASYFEPHAAKVRVYVKSPTGEERKRAEWVNVLWPGDSAGIKVHRWVTTGTQIAANGATTNWELRQTYDARTLAPYGIARTASNGSASSFRIDGNRITGWRRANATAPQRDTTWTVEQLGFVASASDLVPLAVGFRPGKVMTAPLWGPNMPASEMRIFSVIGEESIDVEGSSVKAWKVEERRQSDRVLLATWWLLPKSPYMVYGEVPLPDGSVQRMTEVVVPMSPRP
jgi:hypothetical protein